MGLNLLFDSYKDNDMDVKVLWNKKNGRDYYTAYHEIGLN